MEEVEIKIIEIDPKQVTETLVKMGAQKVFDGDIETLFIDTKNDEIQKRRDVLRLRREGDKAELTYKEVKFGPGAKVAQEHTTEVSDCEEMLKILQLAGLSVTKRMDKHRVSYTMADARFDIDVYRGEFGFIPSFIEIEASEIAIEKYVKQLGYEKKQCLTWSTEQLIEHYRTKKT
jgi:predicted adenylyl cyclase CyaB